MVLLLVVAASGADEGDLPAPRRLPPQPFPAGPGCGLEDDSPARDLVELQRRLTLLKAEREALGAEHQAVAQNLSAARTASSADVAKLRLRLGELLMRLSTRDPPSKGGPLFPPSPLAPGAVPEKSPPAGDKDRAPKEAQPESAKALDPLALAQALFRAGNYDHALKAYGMLKLTGLRAEERAPVQYMIATCLRKLGKTDEAAVLYREVANLRGDENVAACAQWQLSALRWRSETEAQLKELRQRRQAVEKTP